MHKHHKISNFRIGNNKKTWIIIIILIVLLSAACIKFINEDSWRCSKNGWVPHGRPASTKPLFPCGKAEEKLAVEKYLKENISSISPKEEVLGGKFYVTEIVWEGDGYGKVIYEDGHILLKALFDYTIRKIDRNRYTVKIDHFNMILN